MTESSIVISGLGALSPLGDSPAALFSALLEGKSAVTPSSAAPGVGVAEISGFEATRYVTVRGMRLYNRATQLAICAAKLALNDAKIDAAAVPGEELGLIMASTYGHLDVLLEYDRSLVDNGSQRTNGALMPLAIPSAPGAMAALALGAKAFSITLSNNESSFLDALALGSRWLAEGRARVCVVVGSFSASADVLAVAARAGILSSAAAFRVYDRRASGTAFGEGSVAFVLERAENAAGRGASVKGEVGHYGTAFATAEKGLEGALYRASAAALRGAGVTVDQLALVSAAGSGSPELDSAEAKALAALLVERRARIPVTAVKGALGEMIDASAGFQALVALCSLEKGKTAPIAGLTEPAVPGLDYVTAEEPVSGRFALVTAPSRNGACSALVLSSGGPAHGS